MAYFTRNLIHHQSEDGNLQKYMCAYLGGAPKGRLTELFFDQCTGLTEIHLTGILAFQRAHDLAHVF